MGRKLTMLHISPTLVSTVSRKSGVALVIVLSMLVLIAALIVGFFTTVTTDLSVTQSYANAADTRQLSESAVNLVMAQISQGARSSATAAWTSQPGLIRTFDNTGAKGKFYKLYSADSMIADGASFSPASDTPPAAWNLQPALYTDLNSPVLVPNGNTATANFPIIDGNDLVDGGSLNPPVPANKPEANATYLTYDAPVRDSAGNVTQSADGVADIDGFYFKSPATYNGNAAQISGINNPVPMPVRWLYILKNGAITTPQIGASGTIADFSSASSASRPSEANPVVGRIAFWTDDETCKVNVNTAAGDERLKFPINPASGIAFGSFWDIPRADTFVERSGDPNGNGAYLPGLAWSQPYRNEFQRCPGHPATVALSSVFPSFTRDEIGAVIPRVQNGGSQGGTLKLANTGAAAVALDSERLYASVDELMFRPRLNSGSRELNNASKITRDRLEKSKFFLTTASRAPDLNLFGQPRVSIWPVHKNIGGASQSQYCTPQDQLIAFCSTIGKDGKAYYFKRSDASSTTADYENIPRNPQLYAYLQRMTGQAFPGFANTAGGFGAKYSLDRDQILTEIFDYIRCVNLVDVNLPAAGVFTKPLTMSGSGLVAPIQITSPGAGVQTQGFGRFPTLMEAAIQFYVDDVVRNSGGSPVLTSGTMTPSSMRAVLVLKLFNPMHGYCSPVPNLDEIASFSGSGDWAVKVAGSSYSLNLPSSGTNQILNTGGMSSRVWGGEIGLYEQFYASAATGNVKQLGWTASSNVYPFCSDPAKPGVPINATGATTFDFTGGTVTLTFNYHGQAQPVQTIKLYFPPSSSAWPLPKPSAITITDGTNSKTQYGQTLAPYNWRLRGIWNHGADMDANLPHPWWSDVIDSNDTVKSVVAAGPSFTTPKAPYGDMRLVALNRDLTVGDKARYFSPHADYFTSASMAHSLRPGMTGWNLLYPGFTGGTLVPNTLSFPDYNRPAITKGISDITAGGLFPGDYDNGIAAWADGPYANKPDEGNIMNGTTPGGLSQPYFRSELYGTLTSYFSPNRQISSPVMFGSLPAGVKAEIPWRTLLFRPDPTGKHPGGVAPRDHLLLDLFTMPIVEPYAISEPFSTAGRVNLNYQLMPFGNAIVRETGMRSVLASTWMMAIPDSDIASYKAYSKSTSMRNYRFPIDADKTLQQFASRFGNTSDENYNRNFVSASEICDINLYPADLTTGTTAVSDIGAFWKTHRLTGDNSREMPYAHLYPLLTTKSNTYTVHVRVQALKQVRTGRTGAADWLRWDEARDRVVGEYRGSSVIERYIDPNDARFASGSLDPDTQSLDGAYKFRVVSVKKFAP